ncbi:ABC transporter permease [Mucilaginibacter sp. BJC16-A38]|uniref:ABC transporter permease n=1 Tax=Mucilaginibacter phenanthrenivorans TaxID=1234842 RepID=UPI0021587A7B|nr:ABC transporter permease [Mucilaginibacter phenanthrenivorans]MCR8561094.1 ABC transporter permease [Mucilaginibacter phenanthrenivorans]
MLQNYFIIAWRSLWKNKGFSIINIFGLSVGIAFTLLIGAYVWGELQVNHDLKDADNQYIIQSKWKDPNMGYELTTIAQLPKTLKEVYPALVENYYHWDGVGSIVSSGEKHFRESIQICDSTMLSMYGFGLAHGDPGKAFNDPFSAIITERLAIKYFGKTDVVGQTLSIESFKGDKHDFSISGVLNILPKNSVTNVNDNIQNDIFLPAKAADFLGRNMGGWDNVVLAGYVELKKGVTPNQVEQAMRHLIKERAPQRISDNLTPYLVPLKEYYLDANNGVVKKMLYTLSAIALFILLMAVINFVNICVGRSSSRMKEMGIRKVLGGLRKQLIWQFLTEATILVMLATTIALAGYLLARPYFSNVLGRDIIGLFSFPWYAYLILVLFTVFLGSLAGLYPALVLSSLKSVDSLKGKLSSVKENVLFRKILVGFQFGTAAMVFIIAIIISQQVTLCLKGDLGFNKDYVVYSQVPRDWSAKGVKKMETVRYQISQMPQVSSVSLSWHIPDGAGDGMQLYRYGTDPKKAISLNGLTTDNQFGATYGIPLKAGEFFTPQYAPGDSAKIVINESASKALGWKNPKDAVGQLVNMPGTAAPLTICGVTADFHLGSMQRLIQPISFTNVNYTLYYRYLSFKLKPGDMQKSIAALQKQWNILLPGAPFEYHFMDEAIASLYKTEIQLKKASAMATILAITIVFLGVLGLISLSIQKRTREIGIRKVLGSSVPGIINLFLKEFLGIVFIAGLISCPLAYLVMHNWLNGYAYRISITGYPFILSILLLTTLTVVLITLQTIKAAVSNPVKSLRTE